MTDDRRSRAVASPRGLAVADALGAGSFVPSDLAGHHDFDRRYGPGIVRMAWSARSDEEDWRELIARSFDGRGSWGDGAAIGVTAIRVTAIRAAPRAYFADQRQYRRGGRRRFGDAYAFTGRLGSDRGRRGGLRMWFRARR